MNHRTDQELLREYIGRRSETAFTELVRRHLDLVHSAALRMVRDPHLAQDVTQAVFVALAQAPGNSRGVPSCPAGCTARRRISRPMPSAPMSAGRRANRRLLL